MRLTLQPASAVRSFCLPSSGLGRLNDEKPAHVSAIALGLALATTCANAQTAPKAKAAAKAPNHEAMMKPCRASTKDMYTGDQRVFTYGYCVSKLPHAGSQVAGR